MGILAPARFVFLDHEIAGKSPFPAPMQEETPAEDSLARTLLLRLGLPEDPMPETNVKQGREPHAATHAGDAVE